ncbi:MAG: type IV toxin-antitoxin system AbiEi family antitoxin domain-containing protein [Sporichthyaceae bacterium]
MTPELSALSSSQGGPFTTAQAIQCGVTRGWIRHAFEVGRIVRLRQGVFVDAELVAHADDRAMHALDAAGALVLRAFPPDPGRRLPPEQRLAVGHHSAALLWQLRAPLPIVQKPPKGEDARPIQLAGAAAPVRRLVEMVSADRCRRTFRWGVNVKPSTLPDVDVAVLGCLPVTSMERTVVDLARRLPKHDGVMLADHALRRGASVDRLGEVAAMCATWRGGTRATAVVALADGRAESPAETLARCVFVEHRLPTPELQVEMSDGAGKIGRVDLLFREQRTVVEVDGRIKYTDPWGDPREVLLEEKLREERLREAGWEVVRVSWEQLKKNPREVVNRVLAAFARAQRLAI